MTSVASTLLLLLGLPLAAFDSLPAEASIQYVSPLPGARSITPQTNIILRVGAAVDIRSLTATRLVNVTGSLSGEHIGTLTLSDDEQTLIFNPAHPFTPGEEVTVMLAPGVHTREGNAVNPVTFTFFIRERIVPDSIRDEHNCLLGPIVAREPGALPAIDAGRVAPAGNDTLPPDFPYIHTTVYGTPSPGHLFLSNVTLGSPNPAPYLMILDDHGAPVFHRRKTMNCFDFKVQPNGWITYSEGSAQAYHVLDNSYALIDSFRAGNGYPTDLHDLLILQNGHALIMAYDPQIVNMSEIVPGGDTAAVVYGQIVQELDINKNVVFQWRSWDHFAITDAVHINFTTHLIDPVHANAIEQDTDGHILISCRHMDEITKINRQTGEIMWRWGGRNNQFAFTNDTIRFCYQHAIRRIDNGNLTMFDNGNFHTPQFSRAAEYRLDETAMTATLVWQYRNTPDIYGRALGYVQRLASGNTLIGWGAASPAVTEVRPDGSRVFELSFFNNVFSYRAYRFHWNPTSTPETSALPASIDLTQNYPNPFNPITHFRFRIAEPGFVSLKVYDILGREVATLVNEKRGAGRYVVEFDASGLAPNSSGLASGIYLYRLTVGNIALTKKAILLR